MLTFKIYIQNNMVSVINTHLISPIPEMASMASKIPSTEGLQIRHLLFIIIRCFYIILWDNEYLYPIFTKNESVIYVQINDRLYLKSTLG